MEYTSTEFKTTYRLDKASLSCMFLGDSSLGPGKRAKVIFLKANPVDVQCREKLGLMGFRDTGMPARKTITEARTIVNQCFPASCHTRRFVRLGSRYWNLGKRVILDPPKITNGHYDSLNITGRIVRDPCSVLPRQSQARGGHYNRPISHTGSWKGS